MTVSPMARWWVAFAGLVGLLAAHPGRLALQDSPPPGWEQLLSRPQQSPQPLPPQQQPHAVGGGAPTDDGAGGVGELPPPPSLEVLREVRVGLVPGAAGAAPTGGGGDEDEEIRRDSELAGRLYKLVGVSGWDGQLELAKAGQDPQVCCRDDGGTRHQRDGQHLSNLPARHLFGAAGAAAAGRPADAGDGQGALLRAAHGRRCALPAAGLTG